jgi:REP element-mobilizing transposase RayT
MAGRISSHQQLDFLPALKLEKVRLDHGGDIGRGKRKITRPFDPKRSMHVVLRSSQAQGKWSFLAKSNRTRIEVLVQVTAKKLGIKIYRYVNVGNHLHLLIQAKTRRDLQTFFRVISGRIACLVTGAKKTSRTGRFWDKLIYSRIVTWGREFTTLKNYLFKNLLEAFGLVEQKMSAHLGAALKSLKHAGLSPPIMS